MPPKIGATAAAALVDAAMTFHARRLWTQFTNEDPILVRLEAVEYPLFAFVLGSEGEEPGLQLLRGPSAARDFRRILSGGVERAVDETDLLAVTINAREEIPREFRGVLQAARHFGRTAPHFFVKRPYEYLSVPTPADLKMILLALRGLLEAHDRGLLRCLPWREGEPVLEIAVAGDVRRPTVIAREVALPGMVEAPALPPLYSLEGLEVSRRTVVLDFQVVPAPIPNSDIEVRTLIALDAESDELVGVRVVEGTSAEGLESALEDLFELDLGWLPNVLVFASTSLFDAFHEAFAELGVTCSLEPEHESMRDVVAAARMWLAGYDDEAGDEEPPADPETLEDWKLVERRLIEGSSDRFLKEGRFGRGSLDRYFGSARWFEEQPEKGDLVPAFLEWGITCYRPKKRSRTVAEMVLDELPPGPSRTLLEARLAAPVRLWCVDALDFEDGSLTLRDLFGKTEVLVHDALLASTAELDVCLVGRVFPAGSHSFFCSLGPAFFVHQSERVLEELERRKLTFGPEGARGDLRALGALWRLLDDRQPSHPPKLTTTEGDSLVQCRATFRIGDPEALFFALRSRADVDEEEGGTWSWSKPVPAVPGNVLQARLQIIDDTLLVETHAERRMQEVRAWLEAVEGLRFERLEIEPFDPSAVRQAPLDDTLHEPQQIDPDEQRAFLQSAIDQHLLGTLDVPIPALDGRTPREMARTPKGAERVRRWIASHPRPDSPYGPLDVPRKRMLRELGLDD